MQGPDGHTRDFGGMALPGEAQKWVPRTPILGLSGEPIWLSNIIAPDGHTRDFGPLACPSGALKWGLKPPPGRPILRVPGASGYGQNHVYGRLSLVCTAAIWLVLWMHGWLKGGSSSTVHGYSHMG